MSFGGTLTEFFLLPSAFWPGLSGLEKVGASKQGKEVERLLPQHPHPHPHSQLGPTPAKQLFMPLPLFSPFWTNLPFSCLFVRHNDFYPFLAGKQDCHRLKCDPRCTKIAESAVDKSGSSSELWLVESELCLSNLCG